MKWKLGKVLFGVDYETNKCRVYEAGDEVKLYYRWYGKEYENVVTIKSIYPTKLKAHVRDLGETRIISLYNIIEVLD